ncbi:MAG TPA: kelch repeat-containing protein [Blastocatellia bacterium]
MKPPRKIAHPILGLLVVLTGSVSLNGLAFDSVALAQSSQSAQIWIFTGNLNTNRYGHTATLLPNGKVLVVGGGGFPCSGNFCYSTVNSSAELYDPATGRWTYTSSLSRRALHSATLLQNGLVLVVGGDNWGFDIGRFEYINTAELYNPATEKRRPTVSPNTIRGSNKATLLPNGKVLVVGSHDLDSRPVVYSAELYDAATETWSSASAPSILGSLTVLPSGRVLIVSGNSAELYDSVSDTWTAAAHTNIIRAAGAVTLLQNGKLLVTGGDASGTSAAELYDPETGDWSITGSPKEIHNTATLLSDGRVLVAGGADSSFTSVRSAELYDAATGSWSDASNLITARQSHTATLLPDGRVLVAGGVDGDFDIGTDFLATAEIYGAVAIPRIISASVSGKNLVVLGESFDPGALILLNGEEQRTVSDEQNPKTSLIAKKAGKKVRPGDKLQVKNPNGSLSQEFTYTGS